MGIQFEGNPAENRDTSNMDLNKGAYSTPKLPTPVYTLLAALFFFPPAPPASLVPSLSPSFDFDRALSPLTLIGAETALSVSPSSAATFLACAKNKRASRSQMFSM